MEKDKKLVEKQIRSGIKTAEMVLDELPEKEVQALGGIKGLFEQTKINIADSLASYGFTHEAKTISSLDASRANSFSQFEECMMSMAEVC
jgi:hypothetical protein